MHPEKLVVYATLCEEERVCDMGHTHKVPVLSRKILYRTDEQYKMDNGYYTKYVPLYVDRQGRTYYLHETIDYFNNIHYIRKDGVGTSFTYSKPKDGILYSELTAVH
jgi:hypothetical protein